MNAFVENFLKIQDDRLNERLNLQYEEKEMKENEPKRIRIKIKEIKKKQKQSNEYFKQKIIELFTAATDEDLLAWAQYEKEVKDYRQEITKIVDELKLIRMWSQNREENIIKYRKKTLIK